MKTSVVMIPRHGTICMYTGTITAVCCWLIYVYAPVTNRPHFVSEKGILQHKHIKVTKQTWNHLAPSQKALSDLSFYHGLDKNIDRMQAEPLSVLSNYRSPCWFEGLNTTDPYPRKTHIYIRYFNQTPSLLSSYMEEFKVGTSIFKKHLSDSAFGWRLRCLPYFYLIGINRGGSTALWTSLTSHPHMMGSGIRKELHYWNEVRYGGGLDKMGYSAKIHLLKGIPVPRPLRSYVDLFDSSAEKIRTSYITLANGTQFHPMVLGEGTPNYLTDFDKWQLLEPNHGRSEPKYILAHILKQITPQVKIIAALRNPVVRLISAYTMYMKAKNKSADDFHYLATTAIQLMKDCLVTRSLRSCVYDLKIAAKTQPLILKHSLYYPFVKDWMDVFSSQDFTIVRSEDFYANSTDVCNKIFKALGLEPQTHVKLGGKNNRSLFSNVIWTPHQKTLDLLYEFFRPYNALLAQYLGDERYLWKQTK